MFMLFVLILRRIFVLILFFPLEELYFIVFIFLSFWEHNDKRDFYLPRILSLSFPLLKKKQLTTHSPSTDSINKLLNYYIHQ